MRHCHGNKLAPSLVGFFVAHLPADDRSFLAAIFSGRSPLVVVADAGGPARGMHTAARPGRRLGATETRCASGPACSGHPPRYRRHRLLSRHPPARTRNSPRWQPRTPCRSGHPDRSPTVQLHSRAPALSYRSTHSLPSQLAGCAREISPQSSPRRRR